ncbi:MAG: hypothetical protein QNJ31_09095 [Candidatus Caenarcaniphilales bacterium]|nr:hypothetical protein [Candidatus Caenarcaniphilales bacterium]
MSNFPRFRVFNIPQEGREDTVSVTEIFHYPTTITSNNINFQNGQILDLVSLGDEFLDANKSMTGIQITFNDGTRNIGGQLSDLSEADFNKLRRMPRIFIE